MSYGPKSVFTATMAAAGTTAVFNVSRVWDRVYVQIPTMASAANLDVYCSADGGTTYYQLQDKSTPPPMTITKTMASADSTVSAFDLGVAYDRVLLQVGSFPSSTGLDVYGSADGSSFYQLRSVSPTTQAVQSTFAIAASSVANGCLIRIPGGSRYYKILATDSAPSIAVGFKVLCSDSSPTMQSFSVRSTAAAGGAIIPLPGGFQHYKLVADSAPSGALNFKLICGA